MKASARVDLVRIVHVDQQADVEIAVADMADDRRDQACSLRCRAGSRSTHSASREIGTQTSVANALAPGRSAQRRPIGVVARLPEPACGPPACVAQANGPPPNSRAISPKRSRLLGDAGLGAVEFDEQRRHFRQVELRIDVAGLDLQRIEQLDPRYRNAGLDGQDGGVAGTPRPIGNGQTPAAIASGMPCSLSVSSVMTPSVPSEPTSRRVRS